MRYIVSSMKNLLYICGNILGILMRKIVILAIMMLASIAASHVTAQQQWREANHEISAPSNIESRIAEGVEIFSKDGNIVVRLQHKSQVKVFTILGQLVSQATLNAGTSTLKVASRGIYIVKVGNVTQKVAM